ncbi:MAG: hypothetical protein A2015_00475 [Spirochaetes bacterium GWF1_31_7]|nr:MAG: hypothetical protein A2Y30_04035 [Spirochaetes bacterium GWE1_32_154]OHD45150.1 MAG: hypothetical protein A2Y29_15855 [Spirochaetes bacterium GWE2_31_10]OHD51058.1 MAG: hypothetical protein A2015_00475 [Spirochaetes bacterium GWF1_31_7]HBD94381.1 hypothetical protein [Spirochaetia bacterium]HBI37866.1 hypothetical protein [Spirochaetia bacterium]
MLQFKTDTGMVDNVICKFDLDEIHISGHLTQKNPGDYLRDFLFKAHNDVLAHGYKTVKINISKLRFLNSSGIKILVDWIIQVSLLPPDKKYAICFVSDRSSLWQESIITTISIIDPTNISIIKV